MDEKEKKNFLWDWLNHENNIFTNRGSVFLLAETLLFVIISTGVNNSIVPQNIMIIAGLVITLIWLLVNLKHIYGTHRVIVNELNLDPNYVWNEVRKKRKKIFFWSNHFLLGILLPFIFLLLWLYGLLFDCKK